MSRTDSRRKRKRTASKQAWERVLQVKAFTTGHEYLPPLDRGTLQMRGDACVIAVGPEQFFQVSLAGSDLVEAREIVFAYNPGTSVFRIDAVYFVTSQDVARLHSIELWMHSDRLVHALATRGVIPHELSILPLFRDSMCHSSAIVPLPPLKQPRALSRWMIDLEKSILNKTNRLLVDTQVMPLGNTGWVYHRGQDMFLPVTNVPVDLQPVTYRGGIICTSSTKETIWQVGQFLTHNNAPIAREPGFPSVLVPVNASLLILPPDLMFQWLNELPSHLNVVPLFAAEHLAQCTWEVIAQADLVVTTLSVMESVWYCRQERMFVEEYLELSDDVEIGESMAFDATIAKTATRVARQQNRQAHDFWPLMSFDWRRIIWEDLMSLSEPQPRNFGFSVPELTSHVVWGLTRYMPVDRPTIVKALAQAVQCEPKCWTPRISEQVATAVLREFQPPRPLVNQPQLAIHWLDLSSMEKRLLEFRDWSPQQQLALCVVPDLRVLSNSVKAIKQVSLDAAVLELTHIREEKMVTLQGLNTRSQSRLNRLESQLLQENVPQPVRFDVEQQLVRIQESQASIRQLLQDHERAQEFLNRSVEVLRDTTNPVPNCPVCWEVPVDTLTQCGHTFCHLCLSQQFEQVGKECPLCKQQISHQQAFQITELSQPVQQSATKMQYLVKSLTEWKTEQGRLRVVVCAQFLPVLKVVQQTLMTAGISAQVLSGNTWTRYQLMSQFHMGGIEVLLVKVDSIESTAFEVQADHVIFLHALTGPSLAAQNLVYTVGLGMVKDQPQCQIHFMMTRDTLEQDWLNKRCEP